MSTAHATVGTQELPLSLLSQSDRVSRLTLAALGAGALAAAGFAVGAAGAAGVAGVPLGSTGVSDKPEPVAGAAGASEAAGESVAGESEAPALLQAHVLRIKAYPAPLYARQAQEGSKFCDNFVICLKCITH